MKAAFYGRIVFGMSAVVAGILELVWRDSEIGQRVHQIAVPLSTIIIWFVALALVAGGIAMMFMRTARLGSIVIIAVFLIYALWYIPDMIATPGNPVLYVDIGEKFSMVCGALAVYVLTDTNAARAASLNLTNRLVYGVCVLSYAWAQVVYLQYTASLVPNWIPPNQVFWTNLTTAAFALAAIAILINRQAVLATRLLALMLALFGILVWVPHIIAQPGTLSNWNEIASNYLMTGAALIVSGMLGVTVEKPLIPSRNPSVAQRL